MIHSYKEGDLKHQNQNKNVLIKYKLASMMEQIVNWVA